MATNMSALSGASTHNPRTWVSGSHKVHEDRLRRRAGGAYARVAAKREEMAAALRVDPSAVSHRKSGKGGIANILLEISQMECAGIDTTPLLEAIIETQLEARAGVCAVNPKDLAREECELDAAEDQAEIAYLTGSGTLEDWRSALVRYATFAQRAVRALGSHR